MAVKVNLEICNTCKDKDNCPAIPSCPMAALTQKVGGPEVDPQKCVDCGMCTTVCPNGALTL